MLPYWHGASIDFCVRPPPQPQQEQEQEQPPQQQQPQKATAMPSPAVVAAAWQSVSDSLTNNAADFNDNATSCEAEARAAAAVAAAAAAAASVASWSWLDEDRLHSTTRMSSMTDEQRELDSRAAATEEQLLAHRIAHIAEFDDLDLCSLAKWCDNVRDLSQRQVNASNNTCYSRQDQCCTNSCEQDSWLDDDVDYDYDNNGDGNGNSDEDNGDDDDSLSPSQRRHCRQRRHSRQPQPQPQPQPSSPHQANNSNSNSNSNSNINSNINSNSNRPAKAGAAAGPMLHKAAMTAGGHSGSGGQAVASGRSLADIEASVELTRNNSNQQQRYEMRGGHTVEICSRVEFPDRATRDVTVTVEATHSNGCHRVIMFKGLTAKKRPDLGPKVKDCRLRMDQIVMTRPNSASGDWQKSITMSYDSDFQVGIGEDKNRPL